MARKCSVCHHDHRNAIDGAILKGESYRNVSKQFRLSPAALSRHKRHIAAAFVRASERKEAFHEDSLLDKIASLEADARRIQQKAEKAKDLRTAITAVRELTRIVELLAKLRGDIQTAPVTIAHIGPMLVECMDGVPPDVRALIADRLQQLETTGQAKM